MTAARANLTYAAGPMAKKKKAVRRKKQAAASIGLTPAETRTGVSAAEALTPVVERDGGAVLGTYRDPFGGTPVLIVSLPIDRVEPTPYQRDPSDAHVKRLMKVIETLQRFLDPIIVVRHDDRYWTPNGNHRLQAMRRLGAKAIVALLIPDAQIAYQILALNTEKAHNLREKSLETIRMARALADDTREPEEAFAFQFEQPSFLTLGAAYESRPRLSGAVYQSVLRRIDEFLDKPLPKSVAERERRARLVLALDDRVTAIVEKLKARGLDESISPAVRCRANQPHPLFEGGQFRLRRGDGEDDGGRGQVQHRTGEARRGDEGGGPAGRRRLAARGHQITAIASISIIQSGCANCEISTSVEAGPFVPRNSCRNGARSAR